MVDPVILLAPDGFVNNAMVGDFAGRTGHRVAQSSRVPDWLATRVCAGLVVRLTDMERV